jgi:hypothetical protein
MDLLKAAKKSTIPRRNHSILETLIWKVDEPDFGVRV